MNTKRWARWTAAGLSALWLAAAHGQTEDEIRLWRDPVFRRQFMGSYGVKSEIEPRVADTERELLQQVMAAMGGTRGLERARMLLLKSVTPGHSAVFDFTLGNVYFQQDRLDRAAQWYRKAIEKFPSYQRACKNLGLVEVRAGNFGPARAALTRALELGAVDGTTFGLLGFACAGQEEFSAAETAYRQALLLQPDTMDWKLGLARCLFKLNKYPEAVALCDELIRKSPDRVDFWLLQANAYLGLKQPMKAAEIYEYLDLAGEANAQSLGTLGDIYVNEGAMELAADAYVRSMARDSQGSPARHVRNAEILSSRGAAEAASAVIGQIETAWAGRLGDADRARLLKLRARIAMARGADDAEQAGILEEIVRLDPLDGEALILLGQHYARTEQLERSLLYYDRAAALEKFEADARLRKAQALVKATRYQEAVPLLKRVQELRPREEVARYLEQVERLARSRG
jgi:tetratricopeptide (TPR) repeat protein